MYGSVSAYEIDLDAQLESDKFLFLNLDISYIKNLILSWPID